MKFILVLISMVSFLSSPLMAASVKYIEGEGRFYAQEEDSLTFIKKQLLVSAFRDVLTKELKSLGLDQEAFWKSYDEKFEQYFSPIHDQLKKKYGIEEEKEVSKKSRLAYQKKLREKRLVLKARFGRLQRAVNSYSIKRMSRSSQMSNSRYLSLSATVDRKVLNDLFHRFTRGDDTRHFKTLYVSVDFSLNAISWSEVGVEVESDFTNVVKEHWKRHLEEKLKGVVDEVVIASDSQANELEERRKLSAGSIISENIDDSYLDSLWVKLTVEISKEGEMIVNKTRELSFKGDLLLIDLGKNSIVSHFDFIPETGNYLYENEQELSSNVASLVYRLPMNDFDTFRKKLGSLVTKSKSVVIEATSFSNISELYGLIELLQSKGVTLNVVAELESVKGKKAKLKVSYKGDNEAIKKFLRSINKESLDKKRVVDIENIDSPFSFILKNSGNSTEDKNKKINESQKG